MKWCYPMMLMMFCACGGDGTKIEGDGPLAGTAATPEDLNAIYALVASCAGDPKTLSAAIDEIDYVDIFTYKVIGKLIEMGRIKVIDEGLRAVPREEWPE